jgi:hypothetical protein
LEVTWEETTWELNVAAEHSYFVFGRSLVKFLAWRLAILFDVLHGFPQFLYLNAGIIP